MSALPGSLTAGEWAEITGATAGVVALIVVFVGYIARWIAFRRLMVEAAYEAAHNMQHIAHAERDLGGDFVEWPDFTVDRARQLLDLQLFRWTARHPEVYGDLDHMIRNADYLQRFPFDADGIKAATPILQYYAEHAIRLLVHCSGFHGVNEVLRVLGVEWIATPKDSHVRWSWQQAEADRAENKYRTSDRTELIAWEGSPKGDRPSLGATFEGWEDPPPKGKRPSLPWR